jgi:hypothetical protein
MEPLQIVGLVLIPFLIVGGVLILALVWPGRGAFR